MTSFREWKRLRGNRAGSGEAWSLEGRKWVCAKEEGKGETKRLKQRENPEKRNTDARKPEDQ